MIRENARILLVEDDPRDAHLVREALAQTGLEDRDLLAVGRVDTALECLAFHEIECVLLDLTLPDSRGLEALVRMYEAAPDVPIVVLTGSDDEALAIAALRSGAQDYLVKGQMSAASLKRTLRYARERVRIGTALRESEQRCRAIIDHARDVLVTIAPDGRIASLNKAFEAATGWSRETWLHRPFAPLLHPEDLARAAEAFRRVSGREEALKSQELRVLCASGDYLIAEFHWAICRVGGQPVTLLGVARDITERHRVDREIREARAEAEHATNAKSEFLARMSHEIRTPMNGVLGMAELVLETSLTVEQRSRLVTLQGSAQLLLQVIDEILDFSRLEAGKLALASVRFRLRETFDAIQLLQVRAEQKGLTLVYRVAPDVPGTIIGDGNRLYQVLMNLVGNAIKFTARGSIAIEVKRSAAEGSAALAHTAADDGLDLHFTVRDTGIGIAPHKQQVIFSPFEQADGSTFRQYGGTGLGLAISAQLVELMGGRIWVESREGEGSAFHFVVRYGVADEDAVVAEPPGTPHVVAVARAAAAGPARPLRVLLAEDNRVNQEIATLVLQHRGHSVVGAATGVAAIETYEREAFDVILMDVQMPELDGYAATAEIRRREALRPDARRVPIVAMTANALPRDRQKCLAVGMDDFLSKPVPAGALIAMVERQAAAAAAPDPAATEMSSDARAGSPPPPGSS